MASTIDDRDGFQAHDGHHPVDSEQPSRSAIEVARRAPSLSAPGQRYRLADLRAGDPGAPDPLESCCWSELRELIYGENAHRRVLQAEQDEA